MIEQVFRDKLRDSAEIRNRVDGKVFASNIPQGTTGECILIEYISGDHFYHLGGEVAPRKTILRFSCHASNASAADSLSELVRNLISGFRGAVTGSAAATIQCCLNIGDVGADQVIPSDASDKWTHRFASDYEITYLTTVPTLV